MQEIKQTFVINVKNADEAISILSFMSVFIALRGHVLEYIVILLRIPGNSIQKLELYRHKGSLHSFTATGDNINQNEPSHQALCSLTSSLLILHLNVFLIESLLKTRQTTNEV